MIFLSTDLVFYSEYTPHPHLTPASPPTSRARPQRAEHDGQVVRVHAALRAVREAAALDGAERGGGEARGEERAQDGERGFDIARAGLRRGLGGVARAIHEPRRAVLRGVLLARPRARGRQPPPPRGRNTERAFAGERTPPDRMAAWAHAAGAGLA
ncbi:hypothetical protein JB92DRAFT_2829295 [Gautieria morchelliformis]|nr:hypothetical protein JB92DRAFT_2829295 [Gautieria morchelliformis]